MPRYEVVILALFPKRGTHIGILLGLVPYRAGTLALQKVHFQHGGAGGYMAAPGRHQSEGAACGWHTAHMRLCRRAVKPHERAHASLAMYPPGCAVSTARAAVRQHPNGTCPHDHHRCANRCAHVSCTCPEQNSALPVVPTDFVLIAHMRRRACCRRPHLIGARRRADELLAGGASRTSSRTTTEPAARSEPAHRASSSACRTRW